MATAKGLFGRSDARPEFPALLAYYEAIRGDRPMPARRDLDPTAIPELLGKLSLFDVEEGVPPQFRCRLFGELQVALLGQELTNRPIDAVAVPELRNQLRRHLQLVTEGRAPRFFEEVLASMAGRPRYQRLLLPLSAAGGTVDTILTSTLPVDPSIRRAEDWLRPVTAAGPGRG